MFDDRLLDALGAWQNGWKEDQTRKEGLARELEQAVQNLPTQFRSVSGPCYRKRFIYKGELVDVIWNDERDEGIASWTVDIAFAERFKGLVRPGAVSGAILEHRPEAAEVVVNVAALWAEPEFAAAVDTYSSRGGIHAKALLNFKDSQGEVVLKSPIRGSEIIALTGVSSPFDDLCDRAGIPEDKREKIFGELLKGGVYPGEATYTTRQGAQNAIANTIRRIEEKLVAVGYPIKRK
ncbi:hypothetical protein [Thiomonas sp.]|uniref:hypothetical protein n=1 Tax=Thiomonas sp. TaxID=2047785 RepID=UPI00258D555D|nr:hypothetical protein [Thiomonas sp.]